MDHVDVTFHIDPGCPFGYSAWPALTALRWRYGDQLRWRTVMIGLSESPQEYEAKGFDELFLAGAALGFREHGMPFAVQVKPRLWATSPACRAIVAVRLEHPGREIEALRALQLAHFTQDALLDEPRDLREVLAPLGLAGAADAIDTPDVWAAYEADRAESRTALGSPAYVQGKTAEERYTAPSLIFSCEGRVLEAGGFQPLQAYDVLLANLAPALARREPPDDVTEVVDAFAHGLVTAEVAAVAGEDAEERLLEALHDGRIRHERELWLPAAHRGGRFTDTRSSRSASSPAANRAVGA